MGFLVLMFSLIQYLIGVSWLLASISEDQTKKETINHKGLGKWLFTKTDVYTEVMLKARIHT